MARQIAPLFVAAFLAYGYNNIFMTLTPSFVMATGGTLAEAGLQNSVYLVAAVLLRFAFGPIADRWGTKPVMAVGLAAFVAGGALLPLCRGFGPVAIVRCVQAIGLAAFWSSATATVSEAAPPEARGRWLGRYRLVTSASLLLGPVTAFGLVEAMGFAVCFWVLAACAALALACIAAMRGPRPAMGGVAEMRARDRATAPLSAPKVVGLAVTGTLAGAMGYGLLFSFGGTFAAAAGAIENVGWYFTLVGVGGLISNPVAGRLCDRTSPRRLLGAHLLLVAAGLALFAAIGAAPALLVASGVCVGYGYAGAMVCAQALIAQRVASQHQATALAFQQNAIDIGIASASALYGAAFSALGPSALAPFLFQGCVIVLAGLWLVARR